MAGRFDGKQALVLGVANKRSIAWAIAERLAAEGAQLAFTYQGERIEKSVRDLAATVDTKLVTECDVRSDDDLDRVFTETADAFGGGLDVLVHSVAFAAAEDLEGRFADTPRDRFWMAVDISAYSLVACARRARRHRPARPRARPRDGVAGTPSRDDNRSATTLRTGMRTRWALAAPARDRALPREWPCADPLRRGARTGVVLPGRAHVRGGRELAGSYMPIEWYPAST
jgi:NAD(P)-dependent dehydrogenase (short-subunit alcohol dehydrogenase family)